MMLVNFREEYKSSIGMLLLLPKLECDFAHELLQAMKSVTQRRKVNGFSVEMLKARHHKTSQAQGHSYKCDNCYF